MVAESLPYGWQERSPKQVAAIVLLILMAMVLSFVELPVVPLARRIAPHSPRSSWARMCSSSSLAKGLTVSRPQLVNTASAWPWP